MRDNPEQRLSPQSWDVKRSFHPDRTWQNRPDLRCPARHVKTERPEYLVDRRAFSSFGNSDCSLAQCDPPATPLHGGHPEDFAFFKMEGYPHVFTPPRRATAMTIP
jgi:hypothetical protein